MKNCSGRVRGLFISVLFLSFSSLGLSRDIGQNGTAAENGRNNERIPFKIGLLAGTHSTDLSSHPEFDRNISLEAYLKYNLSDEVFLTIGFSYWKARTMELHAPGISIPGQTINSRGFKCDLDFALFSLKDFQLSAGPSIAIESISSASNAAVSFAPQLKIKQSFWKDRFSIVSSAAYKNGMEVLRLAGGAFQYSYFNFSVGIEINPFEF